jgi:hypothetical protein
MLSENLMGETRKFSSDGAQWECTVVGFKNADTALVRIRLSDGIKTTEHEIGRAHV